ncbi:MAG: Dabb family protein [Planctomycetes bacterium]|jgi:hypothetical protein|nr:Dabb family protein [Planctomycetota bacterium]MCP4838865.1 Dabb family protein [Planctomycetota bacterium]
MRIHRVLALFAACALAGCATKPAAIQHVVLISLQDPSDREALLQDCNRLLPHIPTVKSWWCGVPGDFGRSSVDDDYDVALCAGFADGPGYLAYLVDPAHVELVQTWKPKFNWIRIHDVVDPPDTPSNYNGGS